MKTGLLALCLLAAWALEGTERTLSALDAAFADTEATTNCPFDFGRAGVGDFLFDLTLAATVSNNVQLAFGRDADSDGVLSAGETDMMFAWDCGEWRLACPTNEMNYVSVPLTTNDVKHVSWNLRLKHRRPHRLTVEEDGEILFAEKTDCPDGWFYDVGWNVFRLTVRGVDAPNEDVGVKLNVKGYVINVR